MTIIFQNVKEKAVIRGFRVVLLKRLVKVEKAGFLSENESSGESARIMIIFILKRLMWATIFLAIYALKAIISKAIREI